MHERICDGFRGRRANWRPTGSRRHSRLPACATGAEGRLVGAGSACFQEGVQPHQPARTEAEKRSRVAAIAEILRNFPQIFALFHKLPLWKARISAISANFRGRARIRSAECGVRSAECGMGKSRRRQHSVLPGVVPPALDFGRGRRGPAYAGRLRRGKRGRKGRCWRGGWVVSLCIAWYRLVLARYRFEFFLGAGSRVVAGSARFPAKVGHISPHQEAFPPRCARLWPDVDAYARLWSHAEGVLPAKMERGRRDEGPSARSFFLTT